MMILHTLKEYWIVKDEVLKITPQGFLAELELLRGFRFASCSLQFIRELYCSEHPNM